MSSSMEDSGEKRCLLLCIFSNGYRPADRFGGKR